VIGEREKESGDLAVRRRELKDQKKMKLDELITEIHDKTSFAPRQILLLPSLISKQPVFSREV
jgi:threonyl-tRNA synthetase